VYDREFPVFGICQGFEELHLFANDDKPDTLGYVNIYAESRPLSWQVNPKESRMFANFPSDLLTALEREETTLHAHDYVIKSEKYKEDNPLNDFFKILATDTKVYDDGSSDEFVVAVEAYHYPIAGVMFHPETQNIRVMG